MTIAANKVVSLNYTLTDDEGSIIDQSQDGTFAYLHGAQNIIPGLENALVGKASGDAVKVTVEPEEGYGEYNEEMIQVVPMEAFGEHTPEVGQQFQAQSPEGQMMMVAIKDIDGDQITIDGNHPLAGVTLNFDVVITDIRDASAEELEHGHVHGPEGHDH